MELQLDVAAFFVALFAGGAIIVAVTVAALLLRRRHQTQTVWLVVLLLSAATLLVNSTVTLGNLPSLSAHFYYLPFQFTFAIGPSLYFYTRAMLLPERAFGRKDRIHLILPIVQAILFTGLGFSSIALKYRFYQQVDLPWFGLCHSIWSFGNVLIYGTAAMLLLRRRFSAEAANSPLKHTWLRGLVTVVLVVVTTALLLEELLPRLVSALSSTNLYAWPAYNVTSTLVISLALLWIAANAYLYTLRAQLAATPIVQPSPRKETYAIDDVQLNANAQALERLMQEKALYRDPDLTLRGLAGQLGLSSKHLSYVINEATGQNFKSYINHHRIADAKLLLNDPANSHRAVLDLGFEAGFSSKSTFNRVFKETVGCSPSQFRAAQPTD